MKPIVFSNGSSFFEKLSEKYVKHDRGFFIVAPSGSGKTNFCKNQTENNWIDGDDLWIESEAHPDFAWWKEPIEIINRVDKRSDVVTMEAMEEGFWIMGASNFWLKPDAIVIPDWEIHKQYISDRENGEYDGGAESNDYKQVLEHIEFIKKWNINFGVPLYKSIDEAVKALTSDI